MKVTLGLLFFLFSFSAFADGLLFLRGRVPASTKVTVEWEKGKIKTKVTTNSGKKNVSPRIEISRKTSHYLVSVTHP